jgi:hypothetical protein
LKPNKQNIINDILIELEKGIGYKDCFGVICSKSKLAESTYANYWKEANNQYGIKQESIKKALLDTSTEIAKERLKSNILTREKIVEMQSNVVKITYNKFVSTEDIKDADAFNKSISVFNKLEGLDKATKTETELKFNKVSDVQDWILSKNK